jgi:hypothetical protein
MTDTTHEAPDVLIVHGSGPLGRRTRDQIEYAPLGLTIKVQPMPDKISGTKVSVVFVDDLLARTTLAAIKETPHD